jgi:hypothetical protein
VARFSKPYAMLADARFSEFRQSLGATPAHPTQARSGAARTTMARRAPAARGCGACDRSLQPRD